MCVRKILQTPWPLLSPCRHTGDWNKERDSENHDVLLGSGYLYLRRGSMWSSVVVAQKCVPFCCVSFFAHGGQIRSGNPERMPAGVLCSCRQMASC